MHWRFDAADAADIKEADGTNKDPAAITYKHVWTKKREPDDPRPIGGVPLGLGIANDIFANQMRAPDAVAAATFTVAESKTSNTTYA